MRLICPNCDAQYEVDDSAIPDAGRDVQCSSCGHAWFQMRDSFEDDLTDDLTDDLYRDPEPEAVADVPAAVAQTDAPADDPDDEDDMTPLPPPGAGSAPVKRVLDADVLAILREEAELEMAARRADSGGIEMQGDLGLPPPVSPVVGSAAAAAAATASARTETDRRIATMKGEAVPPPRAAARRDLLPDIEEINSSLRPNDSAVSREEARAAKAASSGSGFRSGFVLALLLAAVAVALYVMAPEISAQMPGAADAMASYVAMIDSLRLSVDGLMRQAAGALNGLTGG
ncbi:MAG: zinc-ribbon domain-containing protein [Pseudotabrizicola sp.]|uniref:zinc-ribbon domain-containing protein n=1 Tax=Pseudotabrizicola sp. TaxID=2939647 RepID=UPI002723EB78|nr:zinc-ribbon domain-containing protein [Pseudotabrizicola sp.]MDO9638948.1 zinc-ribbon domain-containing protein [Pseudotabrizicola sp.]